MAWSRSKQLRDLQWDLFVVHYDSQKKLLYVHSSDKSSMHQRLAEVVGGSVLALRGGVAGKESYGVFGPPVDKPYWRTIGSK